MGGGATQINSLSDGKTGFNSVYLGYNAGDISTGFKNSALGEESMNSNDQGEKNTGIGYQTLFSNISGNGNIALGFKAGYNETGSNKLYIENSSSSSPLIWGDFSTDSVIINGGLQVTNKINTPKLQVSYSDDPIDPGYILAAEDNLGNVMWIKNEDEVGAKKIDDLTDGKYDNSDGGLFLGVNAGHDDPGFFQEPRRNVGVGKNALYSNVHGARNVGIGYGANYLNKDGTNNTIIGYYAGGGGSGIHAKYGNVFIGHKAGFDETGDDKLYIENTSSSSPLIWGDFANDVAAINGKLGVGTQTPDAKLTVIAAASGEVGFRVKLGGSTKFKVEANGGVAIGVNSNSTPANGLYVHGDINYNGALTSVSDKRFKINIKPIKNATEKIKSICGVYYDWNRVEFPDREFTDKKQIGVLAQEVEKEFPELVRTGDDGYKSVDYSKLSPILIEAVKEQDMKIKTQDERIKKLEEENQNLQAVINENKNLRNEIKIIKAALNKIVREKAEIKVSSK